VPVLNCEHIKVAYSASGINEVINLKIFGGLVLNMRGSDCGVDRRGAAVRDLTVDGP